MIFEIISVLHSAAGFLLRAALRSISVAVQFRVRCSPILKSILSEKHMCRRFSVCLDLARNLNRCSYYQPQVRFRTLFDKLTKNVVSVGCALLWRLKNESGIAARFSHVNSPNVRFGCIQVKFSVEVEKSRNSVRGSLSAQSHLSLSLSEHVFPYI